MKKKTAKKKGPMGKKCGVRKMAFKRARESKEVVRKRLAKVKENDPSLPLPKFVERVNEIAERYLAPGPPQDARVTSEFSERTVRHYQGKEIIDPPEKEGKEARYRYRHILQAVLTRVMLADGFRVPFIREMLAGKTDQEYEQFLEMGPFAAKKMAREQAGGCGPDEVSSTWVRLMVAPGIEIHVARGVRPPSSPEEAMELQEKLSLTLRGEFQRRRDRRRRHGMEESGGA